MPWWGWLIAGGVVMIFLMFMTIIIVASKTAKRVNDTIDDTLDNMNKEYPWKI